MACWLLGPGGDRWGSGRLEADTSLCPPPEAQVQMKAELNDSARHISGSSLALGESQTCIFQVWVLG